MTVTSTSTAQATSTTTITTVTTDDIYYTTDKTTFTTASSTTTQTYTTVTVDYTTTTVQTDLTTATATTGAVCTSFAIQVSGGTNDGNYLYPASYYSQDDSDFLGYLGFTSDMTSALSWTIGSSGTMYVTGTDASEYWVSWDQGEPSYNYLVTTDSSSQYPWDPVLCSIAYPSGQLSCTIDSAPISFVNCTSDSDLSGEPWLVQDDTSRMSSDASTYGCSQFTLLAVEVTASACS